MAQIMFNILVPKRNKWGRKVRVVALRDAGKSLGFIYNDQERYYTKRTLTKTVSDKEKAVSLGIAIQKVEGERLDESYFQTNQFFEVTITYGTVAFGEPKVKNYIQILCIILKVTSKGSSMGVNFEQRFVRTS